jgi:hypothetical protein
MTHLGSLIVYQGAEMSGKAGRRASSRRSPKLWLERSYTLIRLMLRRVVPTKSQD